MYVGSKNPITEEAVTTIVTRVRQSTVWELVDALGDRKLAKVLALLDECSTPATVDSVCSVPSHGRCVRW